MNTPPTSCLHRGATLQDILSDRQITQTDLAKHTGRTKKMINRIVRGKAAISSDTALRFEKVLGISATFWNNREVAYRVYLARLDDSCP